ncbi:MAG TPA: putative peptidoglycan glycosyltransferase FtsW [Bryobacteraceae bacterium]|nr:putative peptidoglycan glycosyltransferase FtsW [Bryobacteraceae bacterium]
MSRGRMDWILFFTVLAMAAFGLVMVFSASSIVAEIRYREHSYYFAVRQAVAALLGLAAMTLLSQKDYRKLASPSVAFTTLGVTLVLLIAAYVLDTKTHRWIHLGFTNVQPSELAKPAMIVFIAWMTTVRSGFVNSRHTLMQIALAVAAIGGVILLPDFGTAVVLVGTVLSILYIGGIARRYLMMAALGGVLILGVAVVTKPYRLLRVITYADPDFKRITATSLGQRILKYAQSGSKVQDTNYHGLQSRIAVATGGIVGQGLMNSKQKLMFLPEAHTDYIFAILAEETGLVGSTLLLAGFVVVLWRGYRLYWTALDEFGRYLAVGITTCILLQAFMNMSVVLDLGPAKGIPLPLVSYGGSSLLSTMVLAGLLLSVSDRSVDTGEAEA